MVEVHGLARRDHRGGAVFGNDGGAGVFLVGLELVASIELRGKILAVEMDWASWSENLAELRSPWTAEGGRPHMFRI